MSRFKVSRGQGVHGSGARTYHPDQKRIVLETLRRLAGTSERETVETLALLTGVGGRTVRQILSDADGVEVLLGGDDGGVYVAECVEDAHRMTARIASQAMAMLARVERRLTLTATLPRRQSGLFE